MFQKLAEENKLAKVVGNLWQRIRVKIWNGRIPGDTGKWFQEGSELLYDQAGDEEMASQ